VLQHGVILAREENITIVDLEKLLEKASRNFDFEILLLIKVLASTGCRPNSVLDLKFNSLVQRGKNSKELYEIIISESKTQKIERKNIPKSLYLELDALRVKKMAWLER
jgi:integrase